MLGEEGVGWRQKKGLQVEGSLCKDWERNEASRIFIQKHRCEQDPQNLALTSLAC